MGKILKIIHFLPLKIFIWIFLPLAIHAQSNRQSTETYIRKYKDIAIKDMKIYKIPASITLAQGILESGSGNGKLARRANNHFGIKCHKEWNGRTIKFTDDSRHECFRKYRKPEDSYRDHSKFLTQRGRYSFLFRYPITDYRKWAYGLKKAGYATNPKYPQLLIRLIEKYHLDRYDRKIKKHRWFSRRHKKSKIYKEPVPSRFRQVGQSIYGRPRYENNGKKLIIVKTGDTYNKIAEELEIAPARFRQINERKSHQTLFPGDILYLETKANRAERPYSYHVVKQGESLWQIAQLYGIKLNRLRRLNNLPKRYQPTTGSHLKVR